MPRTLRNLLRNIFPIMMVPPGVKPADYLQYFKADIEKLQRGYVMELGKLGVVWVHGGLGVVEVDMPQGMVPTQRSPVFCSQRHPLVGNDFAGIRRQNATFGCRECFVMDVALDAVVSEVDTLLHGRTQAKDMATRREARDTATARQSVQAGEDVLQAQGVHQQPSVLGGNGFNEFSQIPFDPFHAEYLGMCMLILSWFAMSLTAAALAEVNVRLAKLDVPRKCGRLVPWVLSSGSQTSPKKLKLKAQQLAAAVQVSARGCPVILFPFVRVARC